MHQVNSISKFGKLMKQIKSNRVLLLFMLPAVVSFAVFCYAPMYGMIIAFQEYSPGHRLLEEPFRRPGKLY